MSYAVTPEQADFRRSVSRILAQHWSTRRLRELEAGEGEWARDLWQHLVAVGAIGLGMLADESTGSDSIIVGRELGAAAAVLPWCDTGFVLGALSVARHESAAAEQLAKAVCEGAVIGVVTSGAAGRIASFGQFSQGILIVSAQAKTLSYSASTELARVPQATISPVPYASVEIPESAVVIARGSACDAALAQGNRWRALHRISYASGGIAGLCDMTRAYVTTRKQFGKVISSFQAVRHKLADMVIERERSAALAEHLASTVGGDDSYALRISQSYAARAYHECARMACQLHGGYGFTMEYDPQIHFRLSKMLQVESSDGERAWHGAH